MVSVFVSSSPDGVFSTKAIWWMPSDTAAMGTETRAVSPSPSVMSSARTPPPI